MSCDLDVTNEIVHCWGKKFQLYSNIVCFSRILQFSGNQCFLLVFSQMSPVNMVNHPTSSLASSSAAQQAKEILKIAINQQQNSKFSLHYMYVEILSLKATLYYIAMWFSLNAGSNLLKIQQLQILSLSSGTLRR